MYSTHLLMQFGYPLYKLDVWMYNSCPCNIPVHLRGLLVSGERNQLLLLAEKMASFLQFRAVWLHAWVLLSAYNPIEVIIAYFSIVFRNAVAVNSKPSANLRKLRFFFL